MYWFQLVHGISPVKRLYAAAFSGEIQPEAHAKNEEYHPAELRRPVV